MYTIYLHVINVEIVKINTKYSSKKKDIQTNGLQKKISVKI